MLTIGFSFYYFFLLFCGDLRSGGNVALCLLLLRFSLMEPSGELLSGVRWQPVYAGRSLADQSSLGCWRWRTCSSSCLLTVPSVTDFA